jgi:hypothetical protein
MVRHEVVEAMRALADGWWSMVAAEVTERVD